MDTATFSAFAALVGSLIGGLTSMATSWLAERGQFNAGQIERHRRMQTDLYRSFIEEASRRYADAYEHDAPHIPDLVNLYALVSRMRVFSSSNVVEHADRAVRVILDTYQAPNKTFRDVSEILDRSEMNPLRDFSLACREELRRHARRI